MGRTFTRLAHQLVVEGKTVDGLRLMELDVEATLGKVWLISEISQVFLGNRRPLKALTYAMRGLTLNPDDIDSQAG
ncbi:hypothetical protein OAL43_02555 [bacterium]|nr:hypothetical protein [bacterium]